MKDRIAAALVAIIPLSTAAQTREEPLWEAGIGLAALSFPDYRGSRHSKAYVLPAPYLVYRGEVFKADRQGLRGIFFRTERLTLNMSVGASLPVRSSEITVREGMPDLKPAIEAGPSLEVNLWRAGDGRAALDLRLPVRGAVAVSSDPRFIGVQFFPHLNIDVLDPAGASGWKLGLLAGPVFTDSRYNRHYYSVAPEFATAGRPAYEAPGGYGGTQFIAALSKRFPRFWVGAFARYDTLRGAVYEASPLVTSKRYAAGGIAFSWIFAESSRRVTTSELDAR